MRVLLTLALGSRSAAAQCFQDAAEFTTLLEETESTTPENKPFSRGLLLGFIEGVIDFTGMTGLTCVAGITAQDAEVLTRRHFKAVLDRHDALPSRTCAADVIAIIFKERFPCEPPPIGPDTPSP